MRKLDEKQVASGHLYVIMNHSMNYRASIDLSGMFEVQSPHISL